MSMRTRSFLMYRPSVSALLLLALLITLWLAGGASRGDVLGQAVVRAVAWATLILALLFCERPSLANVRPVLFLLLALIALPLAQLIPLPPSLWQALPGREILADAATLSAQPQPWRPLSIVPGGTINAVSSLIVPMATFVLAAGLNETDRRWLPGLVLALIAGATLIGLLQFSGAGFDNSMINDPVGDVRGMFANRNHFALFLAIGCLMAPIWTFLHGHRPLWRSSVAIGLLLLFALTILASGSRAGIILGILALVIGLFLVRQDLQRTLRRAPAWVIPAIVAAIIGMIAILVLISIAADRAESINRAFAVDLDEDMRTRALPTILAMIHIYFPVGTGLGTFDPLFRMHEPFALLRERYFNNAHSDFLEVILNAGVAGILLVLAALGWWLVASARVWRSPGSRDVALGRLGSAMLLLVFVASIVDYPARTPMMMAIVAIAALWLCWGVNAARLRAALPTQNQHL